MRMIAVIASMSVLLLIPRHGQATPVNIEYAFTSARTVGQAAQLGGSVDGTVTVPEPASSASLILGLAALSTRFIRRRRVG